MSHLYYRYTKLLLHLFEVEQDINKTMTEHVFRGTTEECLRHYGSAIGNTGTEGKVARAPMAKFTGANERTVRDWLLARVPPLGKFLIKARYFLEQQRYAVSELEKLDPLVRDLGRIIAHGAVSFTVVSAFAVQMREAFPIIPLS